MADNDRYRSRVDRRQVLAAVGSTGALALSGCIGGSSNGSNNGGSNNSGNGTVGNSGSGGTQTVNYWTLFSGGDGAAMKNIVSNFNNSNQNIKINRQRYPSDQYYEKLYTAMTGGNAPDLAVIHSSRLQRYQDLLTPLGDYIKEETRNAYIEDTWEKTKIGGKRCSLPSNVLSFGLYYNKDIFEEAGLDPESPPESFNDLKKAANSVVENTDKNAFSPAVYNTDFYRPFFMFLRQRGKNLLSKDNSEAAFNNKDGYAIAETMAKMSGEWGWDEANVADDRPTKAFRAGDLAMVPNGTWYYGVVKEQDFNWGMSKPFIGPGASEEATFANSHTIAVPLNPDRSEEKTAAAVEAAEWITQNSLPWGAEAGHLPASKSVLESSELQNSPVWNKTLETFNSMAQDGQLAYLPVTEDNTQYTDPLNRSIANIYSQKTSPKQGIDQAADRVNSNLQ